MNSVERKNDLLAKLASKELTMDKFLEECARWGMEIQCFVDYEVRGYPLPPAKWKEYQALPFKDRNKMSEEFFQQQEIREYLQKKSHVYAANYADYCWLKEMKAYLPDNEDNLALHIKLDAKISEFYHWIYSTDSVIERVRETFAGRIVEKGFSPYSEG
jgi:hypothetical protein